jgi:DNA-binding GntR family transcriptional regulator
LTPFRKPPTALEAVLAELRRALLDGSFKPGSRVNVEAISKELGVSRAPVRDALRVLEGEQQVVYEPHRGYCVPEMSVDDLFDLYRIRQLLETEAALLSIPLLDERALQTVDDAAVATLAALQSQDRVAATYANRLFHFTLLGAAGHSRLVTSIEGAWNADAYRSLYLADLDAALMSAREHSEMAEAARDGDVDAFVVLQDQHREGELRSLLPLVSRAEGVDVTRSSPWRSALASKASSPRRRSGHGEVRGSRARP